MVTTVADAVALVREICSLSTASYRLPTASPRLRNAVKTRNTPVLYDWLMESFSLQGISDRIALDYIDRHGNATWQRIETALAEHHCECPKLGSFATYRRCGYRKAGASCREPLEILNCPVPSLALRKGDLNQQAFSLYYFLRDRCAGDLVGFIERTFAAIDAVGFIDPVTAKHDQLINELTRVHAVSWKLAAMVLGSLLFAGGPLRRDWREVGHSMVTVDSLVHNFLHRTGILQAFDQAHLYGESCYGTRGCAAIINQLADRIDLRQFHRSNPKRSPRIIEVAIWGFCAETHDGFCNGRYIDDRFSCPITDCPVGDQCSRVPLRPNLSAVLG